MQANCESLMHWTILILCVMLFLERFGVHLTKLATPFFTAVFNGKNKDEEAEK